MSDQPRESHFLRNLIMFFMIVGLGFVTYFVMGKASKQMEETKIIMQQIAKRYKYENQQSQGAYIFSSEYCDRYVRILSDVTMASSGPIEFVDLETGIVYVYSEEVVENELKNITWSPAVDENGAFCVYDGDLNLLKAGIPECVVVE